MVVNVEHANWPRRGRVGRCRSGEYEGCLVLVTAEMDERWLVYVAPSPGTSGVYDDFHVGGDLAMADLVDEWDVEWLPDEEGDRLEAEAFDIRRYWPH